MRFIPQMNSLRAIAVLFVIISHYYPATKFLSFGETGVDIFFYLSGFLITSLMLRDKERIEEGALTRSKAIGHFYMRRALRIFPLYYLVILVLYAVAAKTGTGLKENILYFILYVPNMYFYHFRSWDGILSHLWSLGVEEQYYLIWPFIFFFSRGKSARFILILMIITSFFIKLYMSLTSDDLFYNILTVNCIYKFGLGASVIFVADGLGDNFKKHISRHTSLLFLFILAYIAVSVYPFTLAWIVKDLAVFYFFVYTLIISLKIKEGIAYTALSNKILIYLGTISYGLYVFHLIVPWLVTNFLNKIHLLDAIEKGMFFPLICFATTVGLAHISYYYYEQFFLKLKTKFA